MAKQKKDYRKLREVELAWYTSEGFKTPDKKGRLPEVRDDNEPGYAGRTYEELKKIKLPLILDVIGRVQWTIDEVLSAMEPAIQSVAREYTGKRAGFQYDDALSYGRQAVLETLHTDHGYAWFAGYCYQKIEAAIRREAKTSGLIKAGEKHKQWRDSARSIDEVSGDTDTTLGETIGEDILIPRRVRCGDYVIDPKTNKRKFIPTCNNGMIGDQVCDRCGGTGRITIFLERHVAPSDPEGRADMRQKATDSKKAWGIISEALTPKQREVIELLWGFDIGHKRTAEEVSEILKQRDLAANPEKTPETAMGSKNRVKQIELQVNKKIRQLQASNPGLTDLIDRTLDQD